MDAIHTNFTLFDWGILAGYLLLTTWIGHAFRGKQSTIKDFFLAGRSLPWPAVCASIIATEISALTFIGVPGMVFAANGNFTYLQWALGSIVARFLVGIFLVKVYYEREIYSPYDYMSHTLGKGFKTLTTALFTIGSILGQSVRLLVTALILSTVTPLSMNASIIVLSLFAILWTIMGGMTTVIWTDAVQFVMFVFSGVLAFVWIIGSLPGGWNEMITTASEAGKMKLLDLSTDPMLEFTLWVAIFAMPFQNLAAFGTDQLNTQRMFCCRNASDATKAMICSSFSQVITILMLMVGASLYAYYQTFPPNEAIATLFATSPDNVFPIWITTVLPPGLTGLVLAGAFAAAISSLDSALAALSQTSLSVIHGQNPTHLTHAQLVRQSRFSVLIWGLILAATAILIFIVKEKAGLNLISLAFGMVSYTYGPLLGILLLALCKFKPRIQFVILGIALSFLLTLAIRPDFYILTGLTKPDLAILNFSYVWLYPITTFITFLCGVLSPRNPHQSFPS